MTEIQPYIFPTTGQRIGTVLIDDVPWFVAADVCLALDVRTRDVLSALDPDEKMRDTIASTIVDLISEPGLYSAILRSRKPEARAFKRWVTHDVLPAIRQFGRYEGQPLDELEVARRYVAALEHQRVLAAEIEAQRARLDWAEPRAVYTDQHVHGGEDTSLVRDVAKQLGVPEGKFRAWMIDRRLVYRTPIGEYKPCAQLGPRRHWFKLCDQPDAPRLHNGQLRTTLYITPAGKVGIGDLLTRHPLTGIAS